MVYEYSVFTITTQILSYCLALPAFKLEIPVQSTQAFGRQKSERLVGEDYTKKGEMKEKRGGKAQVNI